MKNTIDIARQFLTENTITEDVTVKTLINSIDSLPAAQLLEFWKSMGQYVEKTSLDEENDDWNSVKKSIHNVANLFEKNLNENNL